MKDQTPKTGSDEITGGNSDNKDGWRSALSTIAILLLAPIVAVTLTAFAFQSYEVDGPSMEQTLSNHDRLLVWKVPRTLSKVTHHAYIPKRGEIIIFNKNEGGGYGPQGNRQLIKRVVALPGERVVVRDGKVTVYNDAHPNGFNPDKQGGYSSHLSKETQGDIDIVVKEGEVFVMGDNRANSLDSRVFGPIPAEDIVGKLSIRIFPFNKVDSF